MASAVPSHFLLHDNENNGDEVEKPRAKRLLVFVIGSYLPLTKLGKSTHAKSALNTSRTIRSRKNGP